MENRRTWARDEGLRKVRRVTAQIAGAGLVVSGGIAAMTAGASYASAGHHSTRSNALDAAAGDVAPANSGSQLAPAPSFDDQGLQAPQLAPVYPSPDYSPPPVVSGGS